ncbi:MAG: N-acetylneuraminate synthase family protein [Dehalococcoidia bacterium]|nr:N-acetylneuraminate synthase family protein [Dehalococcoidia bacterium]
MIGDDGRPLFVYEMANNHMGSLEHGLRVIRELHEVSRDFEFSFAFKLQYRELETFIHPDYRTRAEFKHIKRFTETAIDEQMKLALLDEMRKLGFVTMCTPFDEPSVDLIEKHGYDIIKIGSCSFTDWPLLERVAQSDKPIIASTAGATLEDIDSVVSFLDHRGKSFAIMHCSGEYPTIESHLQLNQIDILRQRYPQVRIGYSTHEDPDNFDAVKMAVAKGATIFEKHIGVPTEQVKLNGYSANPQQVKRWLESASRAFAACGATGKRPAASEEEITSLGSLRRGVYAKRPIDRGQRVRLADVFLAMPALDDQITANDMSKYTEFYTEANIGVNEPVLSSNTTRRETREKIYGIVQQVRILLRQSGVVVPPRVDLEISHHYGIDRFHEYGLTMCTIVNREYCKKLIIVLPGQKHPEQYHRVKEETFHVLYGDVWLNLNGSMSQCRAGEVVTVEQGVTHSFGTEGGAIIEEISSTHRADDSFYLDPAIAKNSDRKTLLTYWLG